MSRLMAFSPANIFTTTSYDLFIHHLGHDLLFHHPSMVNYTNNYLANYKHCDDPCDLSKSVLFTIIIVIARYNNH